MVRTYELTFEHPLTLLHSSSDMEANRSQRELSSMISRVLDNNLEVSQRLASLEERSGAHSILNGRLSRGRASIMSTLSSMLPFEFESDLQSSRAYRKATRDTVDFSFRSSVALSHTWSKLSLSDMSIISVVALPICADEISNGYHYGDGSSTNAAFGQELETSDWLLRGDESSQPSSDKEGLAKTNALLAEKVSVVGLFGPKSGTTKFLREYKLVVVGGRNVDKSGLVIRVS
jgi:hypothetical protein